MVIAKFFYIALIAAIDILIYATYIKLNTNKKTGPLFWWAWAALIVVIACHVEIIRLSNLLPLNDLLGALLWSLPVAIVPLVMSFSIERIRNSDLFYPLMKRFLIIGTYFSEIVLYAAIFLIQCVIIFYAVEWYYK
jgi:hypothetical protein